MIILNSFLLLLGLGLVASVMLAIASKIFYVWEDPKIEQVGEALLGANCGGCGYAGCAAAAEAVVKGNAKLDVCTAGGFEVAQDVAAVMGQTIEEREPDISRTSCTYGIQDADLKYNYNGMMDCRGAMLLYGGSKECNIGCLGLGTCTRACPFDALSMGEDNLPVVNKDRCTGCGVCVEVCPKDIITLSSAHRRIMSDYKVSECTAPCQRHCPSEIDIPEYIRQISKGNFLKAVEVIREKTPFPLVCGWICPAPCEYDCRRNLVDEPVAINGLKKFVSNFEMEKGERLMPYLPPAGGMKIAVVGGGVEGLTAAYYLRRLGNSPKVFEATGKLGGILRYVITEDRLPREVLDWEINGILEIGVEAETDKVMGKDFSFSSLFEDGFDMVLVTTGGWDSRQILRGKIWGENVIPNTYLLLDFLYTFSKGEKKSLGEKVVIIGGGRTAPKAANICLNNGSKNVTIVYPFSKKDADSYGIEFEDSDDVNYIFNAMPVELRGEGDKLSEISVLTENGDLKTIALDNLIVGSGRFPEMLFVKEQSEENLEEDENEENTNKWKTADILKVLTHDSDIGIFSVGELGRTSDLSRVVVAVGRGRKMARALQLYITDEKISPEDGVILDEKELQNIYKIEETEKLRASRGNVDTIMTFNEKEAIRHAERCLNCGLICYKKELDLEKINGLEKKIEQD